MSTPPTNLKPAPLSFNSGRASPFRRPESPLGRSSSTLRAATPQGSPLKQSGPNPSPSKLSSSTPQSSMRPFSPAPADDKSWLTTRGTSATPSMPTSPTRASNPTSCMSAYGTPSIPSAAAQPKSVFDSPASQTTPTAKRQAFVRTASSSSTARPLPSAKSSSNDPFSTIPPQHLHTMRESFAVLDRSNAGAISPADVKQQLSELGLDSSSSALSSYFAPGAPQSINLAAYLQFLSSDLANLSRQEELMAAFSAFDEDDSGQIDVGELRDAMLDTMPEPGSGDRQLSEREVDRVMDGFVGRRAFKRGQTGSGLGGGKKDVFRYGDFVTGIWGAGMQNGVQVDR